MSATVEEPTLAEALDEIFATFRQSMYTALPGRIDQYNAAKQTAEVSIGVRDMDPERPFPTLPNVPIMFPRMGDYAMTFPVSVGDTGLVVFTTLEIGQWRQAGQLSTPTDARRHTLASAVFIPGLVPNGKAFAPPPDASAVVIGKPGPSADFVALATKVDAQFTSLRAAIIQGFIAVGSALAANGTNGAVTFSGNYATAPTGALNVKAT